MEESSFCNTSHWLTFILQCHAHSFQQFYLFYLFDCFSPSLWVIYTLGLHWWDSPNENGFAKMKRSWPQASNQLLFGFCTLHHFEMEPGLQGFDFSMLSFLTSSLLVFGIYPLLHFKVFRSRARHKPHHFHSFSYWPRQREINSTTAQFQSSYMSCMWWVAHDLWLRSKLFWQILL